MNWKNWIVALGLATSLFGCARLKMIMDDYPDDNIVEEVAEEALKAYTGLEIDFTPWSSEARVRVPRPKAR